jgi:hypothetical protein
MDQNHDIDKSPANTAGMKAILGEQKAGRAIFKSPDTN